MHENDEAPLAESAPEPALEQATETPSQEPIRKKPAEWAKAKDTPAWQYGGASAGNRWEVRDLPITETEYDTAIAGAAGVESR